MAMNHAMMIHAPQRQSAKTDLTELPAAWLMQLVETLAPEALLALFGTCTAMRDLLLSHCSVNLQFDLPLTALQAVAAQHSLLLACQLSASIKVVLVGSIRASAATHTSACALMSGAMAAAGQQLGAIKKVELRWWVLDTLVPSWLTSTCPNMTTLKLDHCELHGQFEPVPDTSIPNCSQLTHLQLSSCLTIDRLASWRWKPRLDALSGLTSLGVVTDLYYSPPQWLDVIGAQLTRLSLPGRVVTDKDMEMLLAMPRLKELGCHGFDLQHSYTQRPCTWTHVETRAIDIASLGRLPLAGIQSFTAFTGRLYPSAEPGVTARVLAVLNSREVQWGDTEITIDNHVAQAESACLVALMPLLTSCKSFCLASAEPMTVALLAAMGQHLGRCTVVDFVDCVWPAEVLPLVLPSLPPSVCRVHFVRSIAHFTEDEIVTICIHACRPVTVRVGEGWEYGWLDRIKVAIASTVEHLYVKLLPI